MDEQFRLFVDPDALGTWTVPQLAGVLLHEAGHVVRDHAGRARQLGIRAEQHRCWNWAADAELNDDLLCDDIDLPPVPVVPATLGEPTGRAAEYYYDRIIRQRLTLPEEYDADCGPAATGRSEWNGPPSADGQVAGLAPHEVLLVRARVAAAVHAALAAGTSVGAGWRTWAASFTRPQLPWRQLLHVAVRGAVAAAAGQGDYRYDRPPRRRPPRPVLLPALIRPLPCIAIVVDTSASVADEQLGQALNEVHRCLRQVGARRDLLTVYAADTHAHRVRARWSAGPVHGGGATDMRTAIAAALRQRPRPQLIVVLTDGHTPWPERRPPARLVVALLPSPAPPPPPPAWARTIRVDAA